MSSTPKAQQRSRGSPSTPLGPALALRKDEKEQMVNLNNRMAIYVEKVRSLETENSRLQIQISSYESNRSSETRNIKAMFEGELAEARRLLDEVSKEKAQLQIEATSYQEKYEAERARADSLEHDNGVLEKKVKDLSALLSAKEAQCNRWKRERDELFSEVGGLKTKVADLQKELESIQSLLENETLQRVDFENKLQSMKEELLFKDRVHQEELMELRRRQVVSFEEVKQQVSGEYDNKLELTIIELRDQQNADLEALKEEYETKYDLRVKSLQEQLDGARRAQLKGSDTAKAAELKVDRLQTTIRSLQAQNYQDKKLLEVQIENFQSENSNLTNQIQDLEGQIETERQLRISAVISIEKERDSAREMLANMEKEFSQLRDVKLQLDHEIAVYRKLLEEEEERLHLSPDSGKKKSRSRRGGKRKIVAQTTSEESESKKKREVVTATYTSRTVTVQEQERSGAEDVLHQQTGLDPDGNKCVVM